jgi:hypothetical protein
VHIPNWFKTAIKIAPWAAIAAILRKLYGPILAWARRSMGRLRFSDSATMQRLYHDPNFTHDLEVVLLNDLHADLYSVTATATFSGPLENSRVFSLPAIKRFPVGNGDWSSEEISNPQMLFEGKVLRFMLMRIKRNEAANSHSTHFLDGSPLPNGTWKCSLIATAEGRQIAKHTVFGRLPESNSYFVMAPRKNWLTELLLPSASAPASSDFRWR